MGFLKNLKEDFSKAVNELLPDEIVEDKEEEESSEAVEEGRKKKQDKEVPSPATTLQASNAPHTGPQAGVSEANRRKAAALSARCGALARNDAVFRHSEIKGMLLLQHALK